MAAAGGYLVLALLLVACTDLAAAQCLGEPIPWWPGATGQRFLYAIANDTCA